MKPVPFDSAQEGFFLGLGLVAAFLVCASVRDFFGLLLGLLKFFITCLYSFLEDWWVVRKAVREAIRKGTEIKQRWDATKEGNVK